MADTKTIAPKEGPGTQFWNWLTETQVWTSVFRHGRPDSATEPGLAAPVYRETGQCKLHIGTMGDQYDDGFRRYWRPMDVITMQLSGPAAR